MKREGLLDEKLNPSKEALALSGDSEFQEDYRKNVLPRIGDLVKARFDESVLDVATSKGKTYGLPDEVRNRFREGGEAPSPELQAFQRFLRGRLRQDVVVRRAEASAEGQDRSGIIDSISRLAKACGARDEWFSFKCFGGVHHCGAWIG
jgi:hypothetical protein